MAGAEDRLARIADLLGGCPPPDMLAGWDQCAHGTWPCVITRAAWLAQGLHPAEQVRAACQAAASEAELEQASRDADEELQAATSERRLPPWEAEPEAGTGSAMNRTPAPACPPARKGSP